MELADEVEQTSAPSSNNCLLSLSMDFLEFFLLFIEYVIHSVLILHFI